MDALLSFFYLFLLLLFFKKKKTFTITVKKVSHYCTLSFCKSDFLASFFFHVYLEKYQKMGKRKGRKRYGFFLLPFSLLIFLMKQKQKKIF